MDKLKEGIAIFSILIALAIACLGSCFGIGMLLMDQNSFSKDKPKGCNADVKVSTPSECECPRTEEVGSGVVLEAEQDSGVFDSVFDSRKAREARMKKATEDFRYIGE